MLFVCIKKYCTIKVTAHSVDLSIQREPVLRVTPKQKSLWGPFPQKLDDVIWQHPSVRPVHTCVSSGSHPLPKPALVPTPSRFLPGGSALEPALGGLSRPALLLHWSIRRPYYCHTVPPPGTVVFLLFCSLLCVMWDCTYVWWPLGLTFLSFRWMWNFLTFFFFFLKGLYGSVNTGELVFLSTLGLFLC